MWCQNPGLEAGIEAKTQSQSAGCREQRRLREEQKRVQHDWSNTCPDGHMAWGDRTIGPGGALPGLHPVSAAPAP